MCLLHDYGNAFDLKYIIILFLLIKPDHIAQSAAAAALDADTKELRGVEPFFRHDALQLGYGPFGQLHGTFQYCLTHLACHPANLRRIWSNACFCSIDAGNAGIRVTQHFFTLAVRENEKYYDRSS